MELLWGRPAHYCRAGCTIGGPGLPCSPGLPAPLAGLTRRPLAGTTLLEAGDFGSSRALAQRIYFEYEREVAAPGIEAIWQWMARIVTRFGERAVLEALVDVAATHDEQDGWAWFVGGRWRTALTAYGPHPAGLALVTTPEAADAGFDPEQVSPASVRQGLAADIRPFAVCDADDAYATRSSSALATAAATRKLARLRGSRETAARLRRG